MQTLFMIQAFLQRYTELYPDNVQGKIDKEYIFNLWDDDELLVRISDDRYQYTWRSLNEWYSLQDVSQLKRLLNNG